jgi:hypothetical protein
MTEISNSLMALFAKLSTYDERSARLAGIGLMLLSIFMFSFGDALGKFMVATYSVGQLLWLRACAALLVLAPMMWRHRADFMRLERPWLQLLRVTLSTLEVAAFFLATVYLPLADVITYYLACPIFVTALSAILLRERVGWRRWTAVLVGFCGVLIALRPSTQTVSWPAVIALVVAIHGHLHARRADVAIRLGHAELGQPRPVCRGRMHFGRRTAVRQPLAKTRAGQRRGAVSIFDDRLGSGVWLCRVRRRAGARNDRRRSHHHRRRVLYFLARAKARARGSDGQSAGVERESISPSSRP